jgi:hypothetical protein
VTGLVTSVVRRHVSGGVLDEALDVLPEELRRLAVPFHARETTPGKR